MSTLRIKQAKGWFVLKLDDEYNGQHLGGKIAHKVPVECWVYDTGAEKKAVPFGYVQSTFEGDLTDLIRDGDTEQMAELAYDAILSPGGTVYQPFREPLDSLDAWLDSLRTQNDELILEVIETRKGDAKSEVKERPATAVPF